MTDLTPIQIDELKNLVRKTNLTKDETKVLITEARKENLPFYRLKELIEVSQNYAVLPESQIRELIEKTKMRHLSISQVEKLGACSEDEDNEFIETIDSFICILKAAIQDGDSRLQPKQIQGELDKLKKVIDSLSLDARYHIFDQIDMKWPVNRHSRIDENGAIRFDQENDFSRVYFALSQPFSRPNNVTPQKKILMPFLRTLKAKYNIQPGDRERVAQIICEAAGMKCGSSTFRQALEFADEPRRMRPFKPK